MTELKPCPFCGGKGEIYIVDYDGDKSTRKWWFNIRCGKCLLKQSKVYRLDVRFSKNGDIKTLTDERNKAINDWNRRINNG